jgi:hypothetical protein
MDSIKTKSNNYSLINNKAIGGIVIVPENALFRVYIAWEWEDQAKEKFFAIIKSNNLVNDFNGNWIDNISDFGIDVTDKIEVRKLFPTLF